MCKMLPIAGMMDEKLLKYFKTTKEIPKKKADMYCLQKKKKTEEEKNFLEKLYRRHILHNKIA